MAGERWEPQATFWRSRPVAITGATGFLGTHLTHLLHELGADLVILERDRVPRTSVMSAWLDDVSVVHGDVLDQRTLERMLGEYEVRTVFHLAAQTQVVVANANPVSSFETNIGGTWCMLEAVRRSPRVEQVLVASSDKAYGDQPSLPYDESMPLRPVNPYDVSKACADLITTSYHRTWRTPASVTRCGNFFGPGDRNWDRLVPGTIRSLLNGERPVIRSDGTLVRDYLYVLDGALAYLQLAEAMACDERHVGCAYNFSMEHPLSVFEMVELIQRAVGTTLELDVRGQAGGEISAQHLSATKALDELGWSPRYQLDEAMAATVDWYRSDLGFA